MKQSFPNLFGGSFWDVMQDLFALAMHPIGRQGSAYRSTMYQPSRSKYLPHQGKRECARRVRQMAKAAGTP